MDLHWEADDFQNLIASSLSKDTISGKSAEQFLHKVANRQTDRQTDIQWALHTVYTRV